MRRTMIIGALIALAGCNPENERTSAPPASASASLPAAFPQADLAARGAECVVYLGLSGHAHATPGGHDAPIMQQAANQWRASMQFDGAMSEAEIQQLVASSVNVLTSTPADQRDVASTWCIENAPEPDPEK